MAKQTKKAAAATDIDTGAELQQPSGNRSKNETVSPNDELELAGFDYKNLTGESFKKYVRMVGDRSYAEKNDEGQYVPVNGELLQNDKYDFVLLPARPVMVARFPGIENTPFDYVGIKAKDTDPIHTTRMPIKTALEYNAQILNQHSRAGHGKYYFLKK